MDGNKWRTRIAPVTGWGLPIIIITILSGCMSWFEPPRESPETIIQSKREMTKDDLHLRLFTPQASPYIASIKRVFGEKFNHLDRAHHLALLRLFYEDLKHAEAPEAHDLSLFQRLLNLDIEKDSTEINRIYDEVFLKFSTEVGVSNFREEIKGRVANAINIRHDFHEISPFVPLGVGELAYHCIMMGGTIDVETFHPGLNESTAIDSLKGIHDKFDDRLGRRGATRGATRTNQILSAGGDIDPEFIDESSIVLCFSRTNIRIRYIKDGFTGQYRAAQVLNGPFDLEWQGHRAFMACLTSVRPMDIVFSGADTHKALMEKAIGKFNVIEPEPVLNDIYLRQFVFPFPCEWDSTKDISQMPWNCYSCGVDIYGKLEQVVSKDTLDYTVNMVVTDLKDTIFNRTLNRRVAISPGESGPGFHTRYFGGNFHHLSPSKKGPSIYAIGWSFRENESERLAKINLAFTLPNRQTEIPHFPAYIVNRKIEFREDEAGGIYSDIPIFSLPAKLKDSVRIWFPVKGLTPIKHPGTYTGVANLFWVKKGALKEGRARINVRSMIFSYDGDSLLVSDSTQREIMNSLRNGFMGSYELSGPGPNGYFTIDCSVAGLKRGEYDAFIFVADYDPPNESYKLISTASVENIIVQ